MLCNIAAHRSQDAHFFYPERPGAQCSLLGGYSPSVLASPPACPTAIAHRMKILFVDSGHDEIRATRPSHADPPVGTILLQLQLVQTHRQDRSHERLRS